jgi:hypothetical protein
MYWLVLIIEYAVAPQKPLSPHPPFSIEVELVLSYVGSKTHQIVGTPH